MKHKTFILLGRIVPKKNSRMIFVRGGRIVNIPSKKYQEWHKLASDQLIYQGSLQIKIKVVVGIDIIFYFPDDRKKDMSNAAESIMDLLVDCKVIKDDCWQVVNSLTLYAMRIDRKNPRAEVTIRYA